MKNKQIFIFILLFTGFFTAPGKASAQEPVNFQLFYDQLSPYGTWVDDYDYGYVWIPDVPYGFTPYYTNGYWVYTDAGWAWVSSYPWGWAPFHYGRWYTDAIYGPMWIPDNVWGPGWVNWRRSNSYYGWAPLGPDHGHGHGHDGDHDHWTFVRNRDFGRTDIHNYYVNRSRNGAIMPFTKTINNDRQDNGRNGTYNAGPDKEEVQKRSGKTFTPATIGDRNTPGQDISKQQVQMYRPAIKKEDNTGPKPAPGNVKNKQEVKTFEQKKSDAQAEKAKQFVPPPQRTVQPAKPQRSQPTQKNTPTRQPATPKQQKMPDQKAGGRTQPQPTRQSAKPAQAPPVRNNKSTPRQSPAPKKSKSGNKQDH